MKKQRTTQLVLISIGLLLILLTYFYYPYMNKDKLLEDQSYGLRNIFSLSHNM